MSVLGKELKSSIQASSSEKLNLLLIEDNPADARWLIDSIKMQTTVQLNPSCCETLQDGLRHCLDNKPDVIVFDLGLPDAEGLTGLKSVLRATQVCPLVPVVVLTGLDDQLLGIEAVKLGAQDYLIKGSVTCEAIIRSIQFAVERKRAKLPSLRRSAEPPEFGLSQRELEVLALVVEGLSNSEMAERLVVSGETIKTHMRHIMEKLSVSDRTQAAVKAIKNGLL